ncbi:hypothetical protein ACLEEZ_14230 [Lonsdalea quercina]|uniref:hypothetical protein n=1 Tax=Lonsdalea quercina TaxID=71657 RepID=UPI0039767B5F
MDNKTINSLLKKETILVALATALCYTGAYAYERGFSLYFGIPTELISVTPASIITTVALFSTVLMTLYMTSTLPLLVSQNEKIKNKLIIIILTLSPVWILFNLIFFLMAGFKTSTIVFITVFYCLLCLGIEHQPQDKPRNEKNVKGFLSKIDNATAYVFWFSFLFFAITSGMGTFIARTTENFNTFTFSNEEYKLIKNYGDNIIAIKMKDKNNTKGVYIFKAEDLKGVRITQVIVTPLVNE